MLTPSYSSPEGLVGRPSDQAAEADHNGSRNQGLWLSSARRCGGAPTQQSAQNLVPEAAALHGRRAAGPDLAPLQPRHDGGQPRRHARRERLERRGLPAPRHPSCSM